MFDIESLIMNMLYEHYGEAIDTMLKYGRFEVEYDAYTQLYFVGYKLDGGSVGEDMTELILKHEKMSRLVNGERFSIDGAVIDDKLLAVFKSEYDD